MPKFANMVSAFLYLLIFAKIDLSMGQNNNGNKLWILLDDTSMFNCRGGIVVLVIYVLYLPVSVVITVQYNLCNEYCIVSLLYKVTVPLITVYCTTAL